MDDDEYLDQLMTKAERTLDDVANDVRKHLSGAVENIIKAGKYLQEGRDMHPSNNLFHEWCEIEFPTLGRHVNYNMRQVAKKFSDVDPDQQHLGFAVLVELSRKEVPDELVEDFLSSKEYVKKEDVKEAKKEYKQIQEEPEYADLFEKVQQKEITPRQAIEQKKARSLEDYRVRQDQEVVKLTIDDVVTPIFSVVSTWYRDFEGNVTSDQLAEEAWKKLSRNPDLRSPEQMAEELVRLKQFQQVYAEMINNLDTIIEQAQPKLKLVN